MRPRSLAVAVLALLPGTALVALPAVSAGAHPGDPEVLHERWCGDHAAPCIQSAKRGDASLGPDDPVFEVTLSGLLSLSGITNYVYWRVDGPMTTDENWQITLDMGTTRPRYTEGYSAATAVQRIDDGDGTWRVRISARPVVLAEGCNDGYPADCPDKATAVSTQLNGEVWDLVGSGGDSSDRNGFDRSQNADMVNDPDFATTPDGGRVLTSEMWNSPTYTDAGATKKFVGRAKFRIPYQMFRQRFGVPNPETMPVSSLAGSTPGAETAGTWEITHDEVGKAFVAEVNGVTWPGGTTTFARGSVARAAGDDPVRVRVKRGAITPLAPTQVRTKRIDSGKGRVLFSPAVARGAVPTRYRATCVNLARTHTRSATATQSPVTLTELRRGNAYDCRVRALSTVGAGDWSPWVRLAARP